MGCLRGGCLEIDTVARFDHRRVSVVGSLQSDVIGLFASLMEALTATSRLYRPKMLVIGVDAWGADFGLIGIDGMLLRNPIHYRDPRTVGMIEEALKLVSQQELYKISGSQFMPSNTIYQLFALKRSNPTIFSAARKLLMIPDLFSYFLTGEAVGEFTAAATSQALDIGKRQWSKTIFDRLGLPFDILPPIVEPATVLGELLGPIADTASIKDAVVVAPASHDTASAVTAVPARSVRWGFISCGSCSIVGVEVDQPIISDKALSYNIGNEGGIGKRYRFLKNAGGLWVLQEFKKMWERSVGQLTYSDLELAARAAPSFATLIDLDAQAFRYADDMAVALREFCDATGQHCPEKIGEVTRCLLESLALKYRHVVHCLEDVLGLELDTIHIVGGGSRSELLCQWTANALDKPVIAGPAEAAAIGNILVQALALGELATVEEGRECVRDSFSLRSYEPCDVGEWNRAYRRFVSIAEKLPH